MSGERFLVLLKYIASSEKKLQIKNFVKEDMKIDETLKLTALHDLEVQEKLEKFEQSVLHASVPLHQAQRLL